jgi:predicted permease
MNLLRDLRYAVRSLLKSPVFTIVAVLSLALGIGANSAVFTLLDQALLRALPVRDPGQLVQLTQIGGVFGSNTGMHAFSYPMYRDLAKQNQVFSGMFCRQSLPFSIGFQGRNERASGEVVSGTYFPVLGVTPALGRLFTPNDDAARDAAPYAVLAYDYWLSRFAADRSVIGKELLVNDHKLTIVGVAAREFKGIEPLFATQVFVPLAMSAEVTREDKPLDDRRRRWLQVFGRGKPGVTLQAVQSSLQPIYHSILQMEVQQKEFARVSPYDRQQFLKLTLAALPGQSGHSVAKQFLEAPLWAMMAMVGLVLLIACANVANLLIARGAARQKEIAVRLALGASRRQLIGQLLTESLLLGFAGAVLGLLISAWCMRLLVNLLPQQIDPPLVFAVNPDLRVMLFAFFVSLLTALLFGLAPALQLTSSNLSGTLKDQATAVAGSGQAIWRKILVCAQVSLSLLLLLNAGLFIGTLKNLKSLSPGFEVNNLLSFTIDPTLNGYKPDRAKLFYQQLSQSLASLPGVDSASLCIVAPLGFDEWDNSVTVEGYSPKPGEDMNPRFNYISPGYFQTLKIPIFTGRDFTDRDTLGAPKTVIVNEKFAQSFFGKQSAIGRHIGMGNLAGVKTDIEIIGVVRTTKYQTMRDEPSRQVFMPYLQNDWANKMTVFVRTSMPPAQMFPVFRAAVRKLDPNLPVFQLKTEQRAVDDILSVERLAAGLSTAFGVLATVLAAIGLYGVLAFLVTRRTREIGVRMALGASTGDVLRIVLREVFLLAGLGVAVGLPLALGLAYLIRSQLFGLSPFDLPTIFAAVAGLLVVALLSGYLPARRAIHVNPITALRYD